MNNNFIASNKLEEKLILAKEGKIRLSEFIKYFLTSELILPSGSEVKEDGSIDPLFFKKDDQTMLSIFTSIPLLNLYESKIKLYLKMSGKNILMQIPKETGLVINPGYPVGFDITADGIKNIINEFINGK